MWCEINFTIIFFARVGLLSCLHACFHVQHILLIAKCQESFTIKQHLVMNIFASTLLTEWSLVLMGEWHVPVYLGCSGGWAGEEPGENFQTAVHC